MKKKQQNINVATFVDGISWPCIYCNLLVFFLFGKHYNHGKTIDLLSGEPLRIYKKVPT